MGEKRGGKRGPGMGGKRAAPKIPSPEPAVA